jgi:hypothetical protein
MAYCEAKEVVHLDVDCEDILKSQSHNVVLIFARNDRYVPLSFVNELQKRFPACEYQSISMLLLFQLFVEDE